MAWYDIPGVNCIFALDPNSIISEDRKKVYFSNIPGDFLTLKNPSSIITKKEVYAWGVKDFKPLLQDKGFLYETLSLSKSNLVFNRLMKYPNTNEMTFILKLRLRSQSKFLCETETSQSFYGLSFTEDNSTYDNLWRFSSFTDTPGSDLGFYISTRASNFGFVFDTVVLRLDLNNNKGTLITSYGTLEIPSSVISSNGLFPRSSTFKMIGSSTAGWEPEADIVSYGMFDKYLSDTQIEKALEDIDSQFLLEKSYRRSFTSSEYFNLKEVPLNLKELNPKDFNTVHKYIGFDKTLEVFQVQKPKDLEIVDQFPLYDREKYGFSKSTEKKLKIFSKADYSVNLRLQNTLDLKGLVTEEDSPVSVQLFVYEKGSGLLVNTTRSNEKGEFEFKNLNADLEYAVTSFDRKYQYKSIIQDFNTQG